ncbi:small acidic-like protein [Wolffia australiana]
MSTRQGPPKHQNKVAWKPHAGQKINETEVGGKFRPYSDITGVCARCKDQIDWKRRYGKYKPLSEPAKCQRCSKRAVRQAYHNLCTSCAKEHGVCAKCCCKTDKIVGRDITEVEAERKAVEDALKHARERDRRTLLRAMSKGSSEPKESEGSKIIDRSREGELFPAKSIDEYVAQAVENNIRDQQDSLICN